MAFGCRRSSSKSSIALSLTEAALDSLLTDRRSRVRAQRIWVRPRLVRDRLCCAWREQFADQIGALAEAPRLDGSRGGECGFDLGEHPWQRDGEREERAVKVGGGHLRFL